MSKINKTIKWVDLHPRAERLLEDAGVRLSIVAQVAGKPQEEGTSRRTPKRNHRAIKRGEFVVLPRAAVNAINGVIARLANSEYEHVDLRAQSHKIKNVLADGMDFFDVCSIWDDEGIMPTWVEFDAQSEADDQADIRAGNDSAHHPMRKKRAKAAKAAKRMPPMSMHAAAVELEREARRWAARDKRQGKPHIPQGERVLMLRKAMAGKGHNGGPK